MKRENLTLIFCLIALVLALSTLITVIIMFNQSIDNFCLQMKNPTEACLERIEERHLK